MIRIDEDFVINVDANNYMPCVDLHKVSTDKNGNTTDRYYTIGYYSTLDKAVKGIIDYKVRKHLSSNEVSLKQAVNTIQQVYAEYESFLKE